MPPKPSLRRPATSSSPSGTIPLYDTSSSSRSITDSFEESRYSVWLEKSKTEAKDELAAEKKGVGKTVKVVVKRVVKMEENDGKLVNDDIVSCSGEVRTPDCDGVKDSVANKEDKKRGLKKVKKDGVFGKLEVGDVPGTERDKNVVSSSDEFRTSDSVVNDFSTNKEDKTTVNTESPRNVVSCSNEVQTPNSDIVNANKEDKTRVTKKKVVKRGMKRVKKEESGGRFGAIDAADTTNVVSGSNELWTPGSDIVNDLNANKEDKTRVVKNQIVTRGKKRVIKEENGGELRSGQVSNEAEVEIAKAIEFQNSGTDIDNASGKYDVDANININAGKEVETESVVSKGPKRVQKEETNEELGKVGVDNEAKTESTKSSVLGAIEFQTLSSDIAKYSASLSIESDHDASSVVAVGNVNVDTKNAIKNEKKVRKKVGTNEVKKEQPFEEREKKGEAKLENPNTIEFRNPNSDISNSCILRDINHGSDVNDMETDKPDSFHDASNNVNTNANKEENNVRVVKPGSEGSERLEGKKHKVESYDVSGVIKDYSMADDTVLTAEMEALERRKKRKTQIFIGGLDKDAVEEDVRIVFQEIGEIVEVKVKMNEKSGKNKGFAFLRYAFAADAKKAVEISGKIEILGKQCSVEFMKGNDTIYLGNIDKTWKNEHIVKLLQDAGVDKIDKITVKPDPEKPECNVGYAFVELETIRDAQITFGLLEKKSVLGNKKIRVEWAKQLSESDEEEMYKIKTVYAEYLPTSWDEEAVKNHFKKFGEIENVALARNLLTSKRKDFAFINYKNREAALACIKAFTHESSDNEASKVKVYLAKSTPKAKQVKHASAPVIKISNKEKPKAAQTVLHLNQLRRNSVSTSHYYDNINVMVQPQIRSNGDSTSHQFDSSQVTTSTNDELVQLLREQASWRQPQLSLGIGSTSLDFTHSLPPARKRQYSLEYPNYSDPRGYPRLRTDSALSSLNPSVFYPDVSIQSQPHYHLQDLSYASGLPYEVDGYLSRSQTRGGASPGRGSLVYRRY